jgi:cytochrome c-type biogenesis protein CcmH/NrfG
MSGPHFRRPLLAACLLLGLARAHADELTDAVSDLQQRWAVANYELHDKPRVAALELLAQDAQALTARYPQRAEGWIWCGIIRATLAGAHGGLGALGIAKEARGDLEHAIAIDPNALDGAAYTSLGTLYHKVPGWPVGFGDDKHAEQLMRQALALDPNGIDANYFYGEFEYDKGHPADAVRYLEHARAAPPRPGRELADRGRQQEIAALLTKAGAQ